MYNIPYFKAADHEEVLAFIKAHPFALLIASHTDTPQATQVPFLVEEREGKVWLLGHIMRNTDHHKALEKNPKALCVFTGAHSYVSARWYNDQHTASTWNYMAVHVRGSVRFTSGAELVDLLRRTTEYFENDEHSPASFHTLPQEYVSRLEKAIVGVEIEVETIENVFKLSQNKTAEEKTRIINGLEQTAEGKTVAEEMKKLV